jgi:hypothetical protein
MLTISLWLIFKSHDFLSEIALQIAANTAYLFIMAFTLGYYFRDGYLALARRGAEGCYFSWQSKN